MLRNWKQSMQKFQQTASERYVDVKTNAKAKWNNLQEPPSVIPSSWDEKLDANGDLYYIDRTNGEMYRINTGEAKKHKRIDTNEKISLVEEMSRPQKNRNSESRKDSVSLQKMRSDRSDRSQRHSSTTISQGWQCTQCTFENAGNIEQCSICNASRPLPDDDSDDDSQSYQQRKPNRTPQNEEEEKQGTIDNNDPFFPAQNGITQRNIEILNSPIKKTELINGSSSYISAVDTTDDVDDEEEDDVEVVGRHRATSTFDSVNEAINQSLLAMGNVEINKLTDSEKVALLNFIDFTDCEAEIAMEYLPMYNWDAQAAMEKYFEDHPEHPKSRKSSMIFDEPEINEINNLVDHHGQGRRGSKELSIDIKHNQVIEDQKQRKMEEEQTDAEYAQKLHMHELEKQKKRQQKQKQNLQRKQQKEAQKRQKEMEKERKQQQRLLLQQQQQREQQTQKNTYLSLADDAQQSPIHNRMNTDQRIELAVIESKTQAEFDNRVSEYLDIIDKLEQQVVEERTKNEQLTKQLNDALQHKSQLTKNLVDIQTDWDRMFNTFSMMVNQIKNIEKARERGENVYAPVENYEQLLSQLSEMQSPVMYLNNESNTDLYTNVATLFNDSSVVINNTSSVRSNGSKKMSFGAVNELFGDMGPGEITENLLVESSDSAVVSAGVGKVFVVNDHGQGNERLSFGGVGMLFAENKHSITDVLDVSDDEYELPSYNGIVELFESTFDEEYMLKKKRESYGGITEMFLQPLHGKCEQPQYLQKIEESEVEDGGNGDGRAGYTITVQTDEHLPPKTIHSQYHDREQSYLSHVSEMSLTLNTRNSNKHTRGPSFTLQDMFNCNDNSDSDCPSMQSAPEEPHDYFAITAYYGIEDDDGGWDSRRSSWFGDYGQIKSRRESRRIKNQSQEIKALFDIGGFMSNPRMGSHNLSATVSPTKDRKIKRFRSRTDPILEDNEDRHGRRRSKKKKNKKLKKKKSKTKTAAVANTVAELFDEDEDNDIGDKSHHRRGDTYTGVKAMFGSEPTYADGTSSDDEFDNLPHREIIGYEQSKVSPFGGKGKLPRPSTAVSLGATFDLIQHGLIIADRHGISNSMDADDDMSDFDQVPEIQDLEYNLQSKDKMADNADFAEIENDIREKAEKEMNVKLENAKKEMRIELHDELQPELKKEIESELRIELDKEMNELRSEIEMEAKNTFDVKLGVMNENLREMESKITNMKNEMTGSRLAQEICIRSLERSKCELVEATALEINLLRNSIREYSVNIKKLLNILREKKSGGYINKLWNWAI